MAAITIRKETYFYGEEHDLERNKRRVIERILSQYEDNDLELDNADVEYLLAKMGRLPADTQVIH